jgi:hypothetical protein
MSTSNQNQISIPAKAANPHTRSPSHPPPCQPVCHVHRGGESVFHPAEWRNTARVHQIVTTMLAAEAEAVGGWGSGGGCGRGCWRMRQWRRLRPAPLFPHTVTTVLHGMVQQRQWPGARRPASWGLAADDVGGGGGGHTIAQRTATDFVGFVKGHVFLVNSLCMRSM